ncbi:MULTISPECIES: AraC family transcriptional regulator [unclassified Bradyrhizobium]|uniref:AraC family transcriptional regulator n=1 Tax=unclassified Bradyrhizobium TaxID=2631580 RepID=UPI0028EE02A5|nr:MULTISPECIES: AraC family transcriptional regulator [unclassified Bradyrhizobium]
MNLDQSVSLLSRAPVIRTDDPEAMEHALRTVYGATGFTVTKPDGFLGVGNYLRLANIGLGFCSYDGGTSVVKFPEGDFARLQIGLKGRALTVLNRTAIAITERQACIIPPGEPIRIVFEPGYAQLILRISTGALERSLTTLLGAKPAGVLRFDPMAAAVQPNALVLRDLTMFLAHQLDATATELPRAVLAELEQALIVSFLSAHRHNFSELLERDEKDVAPRIVRLTEEYIEASCGRAITIEELASQTGVSIRALYAAFKKSRGYSPTTFAKTVRLRQAKQMLSGADQRTSVSAVAFNCGFGNLGHFARDYREMFGELPSDTLSRGRRAA